MVKYKQNFTKRKNMKYVICSDIHGDLDGARLALEAMERECADRLILLGDILYHGPRNALPHSYDPKAVIELLNKNKEKILAVRGNCDTEVDQMVLDFPILADYAFLDVDGLRIFATHGHKHGRDNPPPISSGEILLTGHTHIPAIERLEGGAYYVNPGSTSISKGNFERSYATLYEGKIEIKNFSGGVIFSKRF